MKPGYTLLELTIGIFLASLLAISLFQSVRNTTTSVEIADDLMDLDMRIAIFHNQFAKDTIGIFVPEKFEQTPAEQEKSAPSKPGQTASLPVEKPVAEQAPQKFPDKLFYAINEEGQLSEFTFITTNPATIYEKGLKVVVKPRMVRVMYRLEQDKRHENAFTIYRQEIESLEIGGLEKKAATPIRSYPILHNIKKLTLEFSYPVKKEETKAQPGPGQPAQPLTPAGSTEQKVSTPLVEKFESRKDWPFKTADEAKEKKVPEYPQYITIHLTLWDTPRLTERTFDLNYPIASFTLFEKKKKKAKKLPQAAPPKGVPNNKINLSGVLTPQTEQKLTQLGQQVFKVTVETNMQKKNMKNTIKELVLSEAHYVTTTHKSTS